MKYRILFLIIIIIFTLFLCLFASYFDNNLKAFEIDENVSMIIKDGSLTNKGATLIITDKTKQNNIFGEWYAIFKLVNKKWKKLDYLINEPIGWLPVGYSTDSNGELIMDVNWENLYGRLKKGKYRIVKKVNQKYIFTEFDIE